jgi:hypothetical protein
MKNEDRDEFLVRALAASIAVVILLAFTYRIFELIKERLG